MVVLTRLKFKSPFSLLMCSDYCALSFSTQVKAEEKAGENHKL